MRTPLLLPEVGHLLVEAVRQLIRFRWWLRLGLLVLAILVWVVHGFDATWAEWVRANNSGAGWGWARGFRHWGAFIDILCFTGLLLLAGRIWSSDRCRRAALVCLLAGAIAGLIADGLRAGTGRPRPRTAQKMQLADRLTGPTFDADFHSFPSGHTSSSMAGGIAISVVLPAAAPVVVASGIGVALSSCCTRNHYLSDVLAGTGLALIVGLALGGAARCRAGLALGTPALHPPTGPV